LGCAPLPASHSPGPLYSPYKHLNMEVDAANPVARSLRDGRLVPLVDWAHGSKDTLPAVSLAFASGECGEEHWGSLDASAVAQANIAALAAKGLRYMISTGGEGNVFTCASDAGMERFIQRYASPAFLGVDFDIESTQTPDGIRALVQRAKFAQAKWPHLRFSFTLATFAASDGSEASLNSMGATVMQALKEEGLQGYFINLMVMNFGPAARANCVVREARCDMAASARQAVQNLHKQFGVPYSHIEVTAMVGVNDVLENVFTLEDAQALGQFVRLSGLAGLHYWSLDRDKPCAGGATELSPTCSSLNQVPELAYLRAFAQGLKSD
jgi:chitinase